MIKMADYTVELLEKDREKLFEKAKTLSKLIEIDSDVLKQHMNDYKELDEKICEIDQILDQIKKPS